MKSSRIKSINPKDPEALRLVIEALEVSEGIRGKKSDRKVTAGEVEKLLKSYGLKSPLEKKATSTGAYIQPPSGVKFVPEFSTENTGVLSWNDPNDNSITGYSIDVRPESGGAVVFTTVTGKVDSYNLPYFKPGLYEVQMRTLTANGRSQLSKLDIAHQVPASEAISGLTLIGSFLDADAVFTWEPAGDSATKEYLVQVYEVDGESPIYHETVSAPFFEFTYAKNVESGLRREFTILVSGINLNGDPGAGAQITVKNPEPVPPVFTQEAKPNRIYLTWDVETTSDYVGTKIRWRKAGAGFKEIIVPRSAEEFEITGLDSSSDYELQIAGVDVFGEGQYSALTGISTAAPLKPSSIQVVPGVNEANLVLTVPAGYQGISIWYGSDSAPTGNSIYTGADTSIKLPGLLSGSQYHIFYRALDEKGVSGALVGPISFQTILLSPVDISGLGDWATKLDPVDKEWFSEQIENDAIAGEKIEGLEVGRLRSGFLSSVFGIVSGGSIETVNNGYKVGMGVYESDGDIYTLISADQSGNIKTGITADGILKAQGAEIEGRMTIGVGSSGYAGLTDKPVGLADINSTESDLFYNITAVAGLPFTNDIIIHGDSDKYYPVVISGGNQAIARHIKIWRNYSEQAPADWASPTHKGGLVFSWHGNFGGWGGVGYRSKILEFSEAYSTMLGDIHITGSGRALVIYLRGGGETGALYHFASDRTLSGIERENPPGRNGIYYNNGVIYPEYDQPQYPESYAVPAPNPLSAPNTARLNGALISDKAYADSTPKTVIDGGLITTGGLELSGLSGFVRAGKSSFTDESPGLWLGMYNGNPHASFGDADSGFKYDPVNKSRFKGKVEITSGSSGYAALSDSPNDLSDLDSAASSKLGGIAANATRNTGALANQDSVVWGSQIAGRPVDEDILNYRLQNSVTRIAAPGGAAFSQNNAGVVGAFKIQLPQGFTSTMMKFTVDIFNYSRGNSISLEISGYNYAGGYWVNCTSKIQGRASIPVRWGVEAGKCCVWIGNTTSVWQHPKVLIRDFSAGYANYTVSNWKDNWVVSVVQALGTIQETDLENLGGADWNHVAGTNKPADNADVTKTTIDGGLITSGGVELEGQDAFFRAGKANYADTTPGVWLGMDAGQPGLNVGDADEYLKYKNGTGLDLKTADLQISNGQAVFSGSISAAAGKFLVGRTDSVTAYGSKPTVASILTEDASTAGLVSYSKNDVGLKGLSSYGYGVWGVGVNKPGGFFETWSGSTEALLAEHSTTGPACRLISDRGLGLIVDAINSVQAEIKPYSKATFPTVVPGGLLVTPHNWFFGARAGNSTYRWCQVKWAHGYFAGNTIPS